MRGPATGNQRMKRHDQGYKRSNPWRVLTLPIVALLSCVVSVLHVVPNRYTKNAAEFKREAERFSPQISHPTSGMRPVYPFSVIPGGAYSAAELRNKLSADAVAARHYQKFQLAQVSSIETQAASLVYVSYRKGGLIYWTRKPIRLARGEKLITDGVLYARARCGNRISTTPEHPVALLEPPDYIFDRPETWQPDVGPLLPPPDQPVESRSRTPETISSLPSNPVRENVAKKRPPFLPLFPFPLPIGSGGGSGSHGNGSTVVTKPGGSSGGKGGTGGGTGGGRGGAGGGTGVVTGGGTVGGVTGSGPSVGGVTGGGTGGGGGSTGGNPGNPVGGGNPGGPSGGGNTPSPPEVAVVPEPNSVLLLLAAAVAIGGTHYWKSKHP